MQDNTPMQNFTLYNFTLNKIFPISHRYRDTTPFIRIFFFSGPYMRKKDQTQLLFSPLLKIAEFTRLRIEFSITLLSIKFSVSLLEKPFITLLGFIWVVLVLWGIRLQINTIATVFRREGYNARFYIIITFIEI